MGFFSSANTHIVISFGLLKYHIESDDASQVCISNPNLFPELQVISNYLHDISIWISTSYLKCNISEIELLVVLTHLQPFSSSFLNGNSISQLLRAKTLVSPVPLLFLATIAEPSANPVSSSFKIDRDPTNSSHLHFYHLSPNHHHLLSGCLKQPPNWSFCSCLSLVHRDNPVKM